MPFLTQGKTNWKYILIVLILAVIVGGGILGWIKKQEVPPVEFPEIKKLEKVVKEKIFEVPMHNLIEGENKIGNIIVTVITSPLTIKTIGKESDIVVKEIDSNLRIKTYSEDDWKARYIIYYKNEKIDEGNWSPFYSGGILKVSTFEYKGDKYLILTEGTGGSGGAWDIHSLYVLSKESNELKRVRSLLGSNTFSFSENGGYLIIGYKDFLYIISSAEGSLGLGACWGSLNIHILDKDKVTDKKHFKAACYAILINRMLIFPEISLVVKNDKLYTKIKDGYFYVISKPYEVEIPQYWASVDEYYLAEGDKLLKSIFEFKNEYLKAAREYNEMLEEGYWIIPKISITEKKAKELPEGLTQIEGLSISKGWLSPLLSRTLNYVFAGEEEKAWKDFNDDFAKFSSEYPLEVKIDPNKIREEIQKELSERRE